MKAIAVTPGTPSSAHLVEMPKPSVDQVADGRGVLVKVLRVGVDGTDKEINNAEYGAAPAGSDFLVIGHEGFGIVEEVGPNVHELKVGDYVVATVRRPGKSIYDLIGTNDMTTDDTYYERGINLLHGYLSEYYAIDWSSSDAKQRATELFREMILNDVQSYSTGGNGALFNYDNQRTPINLDQVHRALLSNSELISQIAPEFATYLKQYPNANLPGVESNLHWSVIDFGLKPTITVSHAAAYTLTNGQTEQYLVASKQIYASRYLDASLTFTMLLRVAGADGPETYPIRSRCRR